MDPSRSGHVLARHAGIDEETGQLLPDADGGPRSLVLSTDFYTVYESRGRKPRLVNLYCTAHVRRHFVRAGARIRFSWSAGRRRGWTGSALFTVPMMS